MAVSQSEVYIETIRRKDQRYNVYFVPLSSIDENNEYIANGLHQNDIVIESISIDGHILRVFDFNGPLILSLKPGKYRIKINFKVNRSLALTMNAKVSKTSNQKVADTSFYEKLKYSGSKETVITVGEKGDYYILFKAFINTFWKSRIVYNDKVIWYLDDYKHGYEFYQTDLRTITSLCTFWEGYKQKYNYPLVTIDDVLDALAANW